MGRTSGCRPWLTAACLTLLQLSLGAAQAGNLSASTNLTAAGYASSSSSSGVSSAGNSTRVPKFSGHSRLQAQKHMQHLGSELWAEVPDRQLIIAQHREDLSWLDQVSYIPHIVYQADNSSAMRSTVKNMREAAVYLQARPNCLALLEHLSCRCPRCPLTRNCCAVHRGALRSAAQLDGLRACTSVFRAHAGQGACATGVPEARARSGCLQCFLLLAAPVGREDARSSMSVACRSCSGAATSMPICGTRISHCPSGGSGQATGYILASHRHAAPSCRAL